LSFTEFSNSEVGDSPRVLDEEGIPEGLESDQKLTLHLLNKSKFSKKERKFFLKQASVMMGLQTVDIGVTALSSMFMSPNSYFYLFESPSDVTLADFLTELERPLDLEIIKRIAFDLLTSLQMLHNKGLVHLDITLMNVLVVNGKGLIANYYQESEESSQNSNVFKGQASRKSATRRM